jgi:hypothetical protein
MRIPLAVAFIFLSQPTTAAYHCPLGEIYRVHLHTCVGSNSKLGRAYAYVVHDYTHLHVRRIASHVGDGQNDMDGMVLGPNRETEPADKDWSVEILKAPEEIERERAIDLLKELLKPR